MKITRLLLVLCCFSFVTSSKCDVPTYFQYAFGVNGKRTRHMSAAKLFDSQLQIDLAKAAAKGDTNRMSLLITQGADINFEGHNGMKPLFWALINKNINGFTFLLDRGADPNAIVNVQPVSDNALTLAAALDAPEFLQKLLVHGANPNSVIGTNSETPIFMAAFWRKTNSVSILLKHGADINWKDSYGRTVMHNAVDGSSFMVALFLFRAGADVTIKNKLNYSPLDHIKKFKDWGVSGDADQVAYNELIVELIKRGLLEKAP